MAVRLTPEPDAPIKTKPIRMSNWDSTGKYEEHIDILVFLRPEVFQAAQDQARRTITERGQSREEIRQDVFMRALFDAQVKGWRIFDADTEKLLKFTPEYLHRLPWDVKAWLNEEILACGGNVATRDLKVRVGEKDYDFRRQDARLGTEPAVEISDPV